MALEEKKKKFQHDTLFDLHHSILGLLAAFLGLGIGNVFGRVHMSSARTRFSTSSGIGPTVYTLMSHVECSYSMHVLHILKQIYNEQPFAFYDFLLDIFYSMFKYKQYR